MNDEDQRPKEEARNRRRDRKARQRHNAMRSGLLKTMLSNLESQRKRDLERIRVGRS